MEKTKRNKYILSIVIIILVIVASVFLVEKNKKNVSVLSYEECLQRGINFETKKDLDSALKEYELAASIKPDQYIPYSNMGGVYQQKKDFTKAEEAFKKALSLDPQAISVYQKLYDLYRYDLKKYPHEIMPFFAEAMQKTNNSMEIVRIYATYLYDVKDYEMALIMWEAMVKAYPDNELYQKRVEEIKAKIKLYVN
jgi:tetratricopeptide (TPR) repeat protein